MIDSKCFPQLSSLDHRRISVATEQEGRRRVEQPGANDVSWLLRAHQQNKETRVQQSGQKPPEEEHHNIDVTPHILVDTDGSPNRLKVGLLLTNQSLFKPSLNVICSQECHFTFVDSYLASYGLDLADP